MNAFLLAAPIFLLLAAAWLAWRYLRLRRRLADYARELRDASPLSLRAADSELEDVALAVRSLAADLTQQLDSLHADHDRLAAVLDQMTDGVLMANAEGYVTFANPAARRLFTTAQPVGRTVTQVMRHHQLVEAWQRCQDTREMQSESLEVPARRQFLQLIAVPDRRGSGSGSLLFVQDLTRVRRLETIRRDFISNISHELRTPLASLKALTETLQGGALSDPEAGPWFLERVITEVDALSQMAQELLDLSRIESGQVQLDLADLPAKQLLDSAADRMRMQSERAEIDLSVECAGDGLMVRADQGRLEQVLVNLIHNAVKFTQPGGSVTLSAVKEEDVEGDAVPMVRFAVKDTGVGIPADDLPRIFERFYRVDKSRAGGGTGLGLSIGRHIIEAHGGRIWAESVEGRGSTFYFTIPAAGVTGDQ
jgi:two-component system phosphate regulon sensor histidine kinase PhoR